MLNITLENWRDYSDELGFSTVPELSIALGVPLRTLESWLYNQRKPAEYTVEMITEKLNSIIRDRYIEDAKLTAKKIKEAGNKKDIRKLRTDLLRAMEYGDWRGIFNAITLMHHLTDVCIGFVFILLKDWDKYDKDYPEKGYYYCVLQTFAIALMALNWYKKPQRDKSLGLFVYFVSNNDSIDWKELGVQAEIDKVLNHKHLGNGSIILFHNDAKYTPECLDTIIKGLKEKGFEIVPISQLIHKDNYYMDVEGRQILNS